MKDYHSVGVLHLDVLMFVVMLSKPASFGCVLLLFMAKLARACMQRLMSGAVLAMQEWTVHNPVEGQTE